MAEGEEQLVGLPTHNEGIDEVSVFCDNYALLRQRATVNLPISSAIAGRHIARMDDIMTAGLQPTGEAPREMRVDKEIHAAIVCRRLTWLKRVAKASTA